MKYLIFIFILIIVVFFGVKIAEAVTGENIRFDFSQGQPALTDDTTSACNDTAVARFDFTLGQPAIVYDTTANCTAAAAGGENVASMDDGQWWLLFE